MPSANLSDEAIAEFVGTQIGKWNRALAIISVPHAAAFRAGIGRYDFGAYFPYYIPFILPFLIVTSMWVRAIYNDFSNTFVRNLGETARRRVIGTSTFLFAMFYPIVLALIAAQFRQFIDPVSLGLICASMVSWFICATWVSAEIYGETMKFLGVEIDN